jgi:hypothetical protein
VCQMSSNIVQCILLAHILPALVRLHMFTYNACMEPRSYVNIRVLADTQRKLKVVAALHQKSMLDTLDYLVAQEYERLQKGGKRDATMHKD